MARKCRGQKILYRVDLTVESESEIEELKETLMSSLESETDAIVARSVVSLDAIAAESKKKKKCVTDRHQMCDKQTDRWTD